MCWYNYRGTSSTEYNWLTGELNITAYREIKIMGLQMNDDEDELKIEKEIQIINPMKNLDY